MALSKNILWTIGGPESPAGAVAARTHVLPVRDMPTVDTNVTRAEDPARTGQRMAIKEFPMKFDVGGSIPLSPRVGPACGKVFKSLLGLEDAPVQIAAVISVRYTGADASCKLTADTSADTLKSEKGALGAEAADAAFGTAGSIDLTAAPTDTVGELVAVIDAYANYEAKLITGAASVASANIISVVTQAAQKRAFLFFTGATGAYARLFHADLTDTEHPTYTTQREKYQGESRFDGGFFHASKFAGALGAFLNMDADLIGFTETADGGASGLSLDDLDPGDPLVWQLGDLELGGKDFPFGANGNWMIDDTPNKEGYGQSTLYRQYHRKGMLSVTGDAQLALDADTYALRADVFASTLRAISMLYRGKTIASSVEEMMIVSLPFIQLTAPFGFPDRNGSIDAKINWKAFNPRGTKYDYPVNIWMISPDSGAF